MELTHFKEKRDSRVQKLYRKNSKTNSIKGDLVEKRHSNVTSKY